ncbi:MAG: hypothetical protein AAGA96_18175 [Verrucomicrobiota bacterium]
MPPPEQHKEVAKYLKGQIGGDVAVSAFRDSNGNRPIPIGQFGSGSDVFYSTIGAFDSPKSLPAGDFEFAAIGSLSWLPDAIASSIYWLSERSCEAWPLVCEDVVRDNVRSNYRHMAFMPSPATFDLSDGRSIRWLLGVPVTDRQIGIEENEVFREAQSHYPAWLFTTTEAEQAGGHQPPTRTEST